MQLLNLGNYMPKLNHMKILAIIYIISTPLYAFGTEPDSKNNVLTLNDLEAVALNQSLDIKSKEYEVIAIQEKSQSLTSNYIPKLSLEGSYIIT